MNLQELSNKEIYIAPSLLAADFSCLEDEVKNLADYGVKILHLDIMDGHFVPNLSFGAGLIKSLKKFKDELIFDAHFMVTSPLSYVKDFKSVGCHHITFHLEAVNEKVLETIEAIRCEGLSVGISIKPMTPVERVLPYVHLVDLILIMTVEPGFGGQKFMDFSDKITVLRDKINSLGLSTHIQVDGGINAQTSSIVYKAGANIFVAGTSFFRHPKGQKAALKELTNDI